MQIREVNSPGLANEFIEFAPRLYDQDQNYIRPWDHDIADVFDPNKNKWFREGKVARWLLTDVKGETIGRIAAFTHPKLEREDEKTGGCGFFECINDQDAANILFDEARKWLLTEGKQMMDGPINFGEKDKWWGLLVDGFEPPLYGMNYNPPYYQQLFENYGFRDYYQQYVYRYDLTKPAPDKFHRVYNLLLKKGDFRFEHAKKSELEKYAEDFRTVYNKAWGNTHEGFKPMTKEQSAALMKKIKPIMLEEAMIYGYHEDEPVGIFLSLPNLNQVIQHLKGKFGLWEKLKFMYHLKVAKSYDTLSAIIFGIVPEYQGKGVDAGLAVKGEEMMVKPGKFKFLELMWIGDFNPKMLRITDQLDTTLSKRYITYRYLFDKSAEFKRHPVVNV